MSAMDRLASAEETWAAADAASGATPSRAILQTREDIRRLYREDALLAGELPNALRLDTERVLEVHEDGSATVHARGRGPVTWPAKRVTELRRFLDAVGAMSRDPALTPNDAARLLALADEAERHSPLRRCPDCGNVHDPRPCAETGATCSCCAALYGTDDHRTAACDALDAAGVEVAPDGGVA